MIGNRYLAAAVAFGAGLAAVSAATAHTESGPATPAAAAQTAEPPVQSPSQWVPAMPDFKAWDPKSNQPTYSVTPPPGDSGVYLPAAVLGYGKSVAGCIVIGCDDGPQVGGAAGSSPGSVEPPTDRPGPVDPH